MNAKTTTSAADYLPKKHDLKSLARAAQKCEGCDLFQNATQAVFGEGSPQARLILVGEQPGDQEDRQGRPFVGPAGRVLDQALEAAGITRDDVFVTNTVKHFKWTPRGNRRLHVKPTAREINACHPWLEAEIEAIGAEMIVCLGATAAQALIGRSFRITRQHGEILPGDLVPWMMATYHPSAVIRIPDKTARANMRAALEDDLRGAEEHLRAHA